MQHRVISATEFRAKCLALFDEIAEKGGTITITKRGRPVATVAPAPKTASDQRIIASKLVPVID